MHFSARLVFHVKKDEKELHLTGTPLEADFHISRNSARGFSKDPKIAGMRVHELLRKNMFVVIPPPGPKMPRKSSIGIKRVSILDSAWIESNENSIEFEIISSCPILAIGSLTSPSESWHAITGKEGVQPRGAREADDPACTKFGECDGYADFAARLGCDPDTLHNYFIAFWWHMRHGDPKEKGRKGIKPPEKSKAPREIHWRDSLEIESLVGFGIRP